MSFLSYFIGRLGCREVSATLVGHFLHSAKTYFMLQLCCYIPQSFSCYPYLCHLNIYIQTIKIACFPGAELMQIQNMKTFCCFFFVFRPYSSVLWLAKRKYMTRQWWIQHLISAFCSHPCLMYQKFFFVTALSY